VLITGITAFMLNPGVWAEDPQSRNFWTAFFNPQFLPQTLARTGGALLLSSLYIYLHASLMLGDGARPPSAMPDNSTQPGAAALQDDDERLRRLIAMRSARPAWLGAVLLTVGGALWHYHLPPSAAAALLSAAALNVLMALVLALTLVIFALLYLGPYRNPGWLSPGFALSLCLFGVAAFSAGEFVREAVRKPFVVYNVVLGNQILPEEAAPFRKAGYLESGTWTRAYMAERYPQTLVGGRIDERELLQLAPADRAAVGAVLFQYHCNDCHAVNDGYSAAGALLRGRPREVIRSMLDHLEAVFFMPSWSGTAEEAELLTDYLMSIRPPRPEGMKIDARINTTENQTTDSKK